MNKPISILIVGIGGYGSGYVSSLLDNKDDDRFYITGAVDPVPAACRRLSELEDKNIQIYSSIEEYYEGGRSADLVLISSPIQYHCQQTCFALSHGSNVLCEKPIAATVQEAQKMIEHRDKSGKLLAIGFQWSYSDAMLSLKKDIMEGVLGKTKRLKSMILWPRNYDYYNRSWAGIIKDKAGNWVLDSIANNATAHYLHNMFFVLGDKINTSAKLTNVEAEVYRANKIQNFDTAILKAYTQEGTEILYYATHATKELLDPVFSYEFENAVVTYDKNTGNEITAKFNNGEVKSYGDPFKDQMEKLWTVIDAIEKGNQSIPCGVETALPHLLCINAIQDAVHEIPRFPEELIVEDEDLIGNNVKGVYVKDLNNVLKDCYERWTMPSEENIAWAKSTGEINIKDYTHFMGRDL